MKNILFHPNDGNPVFIALSSEMTFDVIYQGSPKSSHNSITSAIESATMEFIGSASTVRSDWIIAEK